MKGNNTQPLFLCDHKSMDYFFRFIDLGIIRGKMSMNYCYLSRMNATHPFKSQGL